MTSKVLRERLISLHAQHGEAHRRMMAALETDDLLALVQASREQGAICTEQGALLADYVAAVMVQFPDLDPADRERIDHLAGELRNAHLDDQKQKAG